jgi:hypothetical protein
MCSGWERQIEFVILRGSLGSGKCFPHDLSDITTILRANYLCDSRAIRDGRLPPATAILTSQDRYRSHTRRLRVSGIRHQNEASFCMTEPGAEIVGTEKLKFRCSAL